MKPELDKLEFEEERGLLERELSELFETTFKMEYELELVLQKKSTSG